MFRIQRRAVAFLVGSATLVAAPATLAAPSVSPITQFPKRGPIAARNTVVAVTQLDGDSATMLVGKGGNIPIARAAIKSLPAWGQPHIGTDANRKPVVIYPHCTDDTDVKTCDLRVYDVLSGQDAAVTGVNKPGIGETEGSMDRGAVAFTRWTAKWQPNIATETAGGGLGSRTTLAYRAVGKTARVLTTEGGEQITLDRGRVVQVRDTEVGYGICGYPTVEIVRTDGGKRRTLKSHGCGLNSQTILSPVFVGAYVMWGVRTIDEMLVERVSPAGGKVETAKVPGGFSTIVPTARSGAKLIDGPWLSQPGSQEEKDGGPWELKYVIGLSFP